MHIAQGGKAVEVKYLTVFPVRCYNYCYIKLVIRHSNLHFVFMNEPNIFIDTCRGKANQFRAVCKR